MRRIQRPSFWRLLLGVIQVEGHAPPPVIPASADDSRAAMSGERAATSAAPNAPKCANMRSFPVDDEMRRPLPAAGVSVSRGAGLLGFSHRLFLGCIHGIAGLQGCDGQKVVVVLLR